MIDCSEWFRPMTVLRFKEQLFKSKLLHHLFIHSFKMQLTDFPQIVNSSKDWMFST